MRERILFLLLIIWGCAIPGAVAQQVQALPKLERSYLNTFYKENDPSSKKCFEGTLMDGNGRLWLKPCGVDILINSIGLFQFDGYSFQPIEAFKEDGSILDIPWVRAVEESGRILGTESQNGFFVMDPDTRISKTNLFTYNALQILRTLAVSTEYGKSHVLGMKQDSTLALFQLEDDQLTPISSFRHPITSGRLDSYFMRNEEEEIWIGSPDFEIIRFDTERLEKKVYTLEDFKTKGPISVPVSKDNWPRPRIFFNAQGDAYLLLPAGEGLQLLKYDPVQDHFATTSDQFPDTWQVQDIFPDQAGQICLLFMDRSGDYHALLSTNSGAWFDYSDVIAGQKEIRSLASQNFMQQVFMITGKGLVTAGIRNQKLIQQTLQGKWISSMAQLPDRRVLINTIRDGWFTYNQETVETTAFKGPDCHITPPPFGKGMRQQIIPDDKGRLWLLSHSHLVRFDPRTQSCKTYPLKTRSALFALVRDDLAIIQYNRAEIFFLDLKTNKEVSFGPGVQRSFQGFVRDILVAGNGIVWIPTNNGLWRIDLEKEQSEKLSTEQGFSDFRFTSIWEDQRGRLWLGTLLGGLNLYDPKSKTIKVINKGQGLSSNTVMSIIEDEEGDIWVGTEYGINLVSKEGVVLNSFHKEDGLTSDVFERFDPFKDEDGKLWFGSREGASILDPVALKNELQSEEEVKIYLTEIGYYDTELNAEVVRHRNLAHLGVLEIAPEHPHLRLRFGLSSYLRPEDNRYAYMIEGKDKDWRYLGTQPELNISRLPPGKYRLLIKGADFRNNWTTNPIAIDIHAREFFYKQAWFYLLLALPFIAFGLLWARNKQQESRRLEREVRLRTRQIRKDKKLIEQQAEELKQLDELKSRFFTNISHELRTPVTLIKAPLEHLIQAQGSSLTQSIKEGLQKVLNNAGKLSRLIEELLELSRLEAKKAELKEVPTPLAAFCRQLFAAYESGAHLKHIEYQLECELEEDALYLIDRNRFEKIINNLLSNALKFTPKNGAITMRSRQAAGNLVIEVTDSGRGIPGEDLPHIFDRYFQTRKTEIATEGGTGIGLALSQEMAELMNGAITVDSKWGEGASFVLTFPAKRAEGEKAAHPLLSKPIPVRSFPETVERPASLNGSGHPKVLIVEDNPDMQQLLLELLSDTYHCQVANHGAEAWSWLESKSAEVQDIELIVSDVMMPEMDGYTLLEKIKAHADWQQLPVIMLTARSAEEDKLQALRMGVDDYLLKPFSPDELKARMENLIRNYQTRQAVPEPDPAPLAQPDFEFQTKSTSAGQDWLKEVETAAKAALEKGIKLNTLLLAEQVFLSERQFARRLKKLTGLTPNNYIQEARLQLARQLLERQVYTTVNEVAQAAGYSSGSYLTKVYDQRFGKKPGDYFQ
ncbi:ATP-binding protein [Phaeodactylibacter xiamenensis]|uniref:ATP-binding protein n=2 Tax=Phaeodactylibacter xiamenensis TaxID=1524460 RepID=UPI003BA943D6